MPRTRPAGMRQQYRGFLLLERKGLMLYNTSVALEVNW